MNRRHVVGASLALSALLAVGGCTHQAETQVSPAAAVYSYDGTKVPGKWLGVVRTGGMTKTVETTGYTCSAHNFPLSSDQAFETSTKMTLAKVFESIEFAPSPVTREELVERGYTGFVLVKPADYDPKIRFVAGMFSGTASASVEQSADVVVEGQQALLFRGRPQVSKSVDVPGVQCDGGARALADASEAALRKLMEEIAERLANAQQLRTAAGAAGTGGAGLATVETR